jgi:magnesium chelatase family protein
MICQITSFTFQGIDTISINIQSHLANGLPSFSIVGLPDKTIAEARERVRAALSHIGLALPSKRITVNLSPADIDKEGSHFDLPIALAILGAMGAFPAEYLDDFCALGELSLSGELLATNGILPAAIGAMEKKLGIICPKANIQEAHWSGNQKIIAADSLLSILQHFAGKNIIETPHNINLPKLNSKKRTDEFLDIKGQELAKRAILIAASGGHNLLMFGPPGAGKSLLAKRMSAIMPVMNPRQILETSKIYSVAGMLPEGGLQIDRPFRNPHHNATAVALIGGGRNRKIFPGEISLAHNGVLFLDELPEFNKVALESLRQPLEDKKVNISRANSCITLPANFQLIAAMNPCKCGYFNEADKACNKAPNCSKDYLNKISGPLLDRFDMFVYLSSIQPQDLENAKLDSRVTEERDIVENTHIIQSNRFKDNDWKLNSNIPASYLNEKIEIANDAKSLLMAATEKYKFSLRGYYRIIRVARTIADLDNKDLINEDHILESISYRINDNFKGALK